MLESIARAADLLIVNDNAPEPSPHAQTLRDSVFGKEGRLVVDRTPFSGFAAARNVCLKIHDECGGGKWAMFVDADEVHGERVERIARRLGRVPADVAAVDAYTWHFFGSFDYYTSIERRMMFFRHRGDLRWEGEVHERLVGLAGTRIALPYVYAHYGHTLEPRRHAEKGRHYSALGAPGTVLREEELDAFDVAHYFAPVYPRLLRFAGQHPPAARATLERWLPTLRFHHEMTGRIARSQTAYVKARNAVRKLNYELRWRGRGIARLARDLCA